MAWGNNGHGPGMDGFSSNPGFGNSHGFVEGHSVVDVGREHTWYNCGETGHNKADCFTPRQFSGQCNSCGKEGHLSKDCPDSGPMVCRQCKKEGHMAKDCEVPIVCPRCKENHYIRDCPMPMVCRFCEQEGHLARECPVAPPRVCMNCREEGHDASSCEAPRKIDRDAIPEQSPAEALKLLRQAVAEKDLDDAKIAVQIYVKALPGTTYVQLEQLLRAEKISLFLIAVEKTDMSVTLTNMDLQGNLDKKYSVTYRFQSRPSRPREKTMWPLSASENLARLADGGEPVPRGIPLCSNCSELGHVSRLCPAEKQEVLDKATVTCYNCGETGHRFRDCKTPRTDKFACRNCGLSGHTGKDCPGPRSAENVECRKCGETGHFSKDCPQGGGGDDTCRNCGLLGHIARDCTEPRKIVCRNCDKEGHVSRECLEPRNISRMQCYNCNEYGHKSKDCQLPRNMNGAHCSNCQQTDHLRSACKYRAPGEVGDHATMADTGFNGYSFGHGNSSLPDAVEVTSMAGGGVW